MQQETSLASQIVEHGLHFCGGMRISGVSGDPDTLRQPRASLFRLPGLQEQLRGHLVGGYVLGGISQNCCIFRERLIVFSFCRKGHGEAIPSEGVSRVLLQDLGECRNFVHLS